MAKNLIIEKRLKDLEKRVKELEESPCFKAYKDYDPDEKDELFEKAVKTIQQYDGASASLLQRRLSLGYARASRLLDQLENEGYVGPAIGSSPRKVLKK